MNEQDTDWVHQNCCNPTVVCEWCTYIEFGVLTSCLWPELWLVICIEIIEFSKLPNLQELSFSL